MAENVVAAALEDLADGEVAANVKGAGHLETDIRQSLAAVMDEVGASFLKTHSLEIVAHVADEIEAGAPESDHREAEALANLVAVAHVNSAGESGAVVEKAGADALAALALVEIVGVEIDAGGAGSPAILGAHPAPPYVISMPERRVA